VGGSVAYARTACSWSTGTDNAHADSLDEGANDLEESLHWLTAVVSAHTQKNGPIAGKWRSLYPCYTITSVYIKL